MTTFLIWFGAFALALGATAFGVTTTITREAWNRVPLDVYLWEATIVCVLIWIVCGLIKVLQWV